MRYSLTSRPPALTGLTCCNGKGSTRRRRALLITPGLSALGASRGLGEAVTGFSVGDEVCALLAGGGYAEKVAVHAGQVLPVPDGTSVVEAGGLMEVACTVYSNVVQLAGLAAGETLLIHGGASGIGTFAIQLGRALGARVACTAGSRRQARPLPGAGRRAGDPATRTRTSSRRSRSSPADAAPT